MWGTICSLLIGCTIGWILGGFIRLGILFGAVFWWVVDLLCAAIGRRRERRRPGPTPWLRR